MSAVSNFVTRIDGYREIATMSTTLYRPYEPIGRKAERAQSSFLETIVGRRGGKQAPGYGDITNEATNGCNG